MDTASLQVLARAGLIRPSRPDRALGALLALGRWGVTFAGGVSAGAARHPDRVLLVDDQGPLTYAEVDRRTDAGASLLRERGVVPGDVVGLLARNGRGWVEGAVSLAKAGADAVHLGPTTGRTQVDAVLRREGAVAVLHDPDLEPPPGRAVSTADLPAGPSGRPPRTGRAPRQVILTSGTTGAPRGAARSGVGLPDAVAFLGAVPLRARETTVVATPLFHAWGLAQFSLGLMLGSTLVLRARSDAEVLVRDVAEHRATALATVPVVLERMLDAGLRALPDLRVVVTSGSALHPDLVVRALDALGPVLHNLYGSTEVAWAAVARPEHLSADPRTAGEPLRGIALRVDAPPGEVGEVLVGSGMAFAGYTDGSDRDRRDGLVATGDLGVLKDGLLRLVGRADDMVVVGGENVHLSAVEEVVRTAPGVRDAAVTAEEDASYGARIVAHVVGDTTLDRLQEHVRERLARHAVPRALVVHEELPRTPSGKVVRRHLGESGA